ncbi:hypothetical protein OUY22_33775 [Nonomuraea sp. MCN248]|uniref:N-acetyltransferase n=1 Tax=Nonomuraea corallina TaxID=2989783 RepID=A0ABT4SME7_9ACTN|nr:hypothetical protein [Nonomuraea corallina]MDA0638402.1 hypothetical protein [Nonomuraea corallina]
MAVEWSRAEILEALRTCALHSATMVDGYSGLDVVAKPDAMLLTFRWCRDPNVYAVEVAYPTEPSSPWTGLPVPSAFAWAADVMAGLQENLATGLVMWGRRTVRDGSIVLAYRDPADVLPAGYFVTPVFRVGVPRSSGPEREGTSFTYASPEALVPLPPSEAGSHLAAEGMDVSLPRRLLAEDRLACWHEAYVDNSRGEPHVGHAVASWDDPSRTTARLALVHIQPGVPSDVRTALARFAVRAVTEAGALRVVTAIGTPELRELGFQPADGDGLILHTSITGP